jgi:hypothetical protein
MPLFFDLQYLLMGINLISEGCPQNSRLAMDISEVPSRLHGSSDGL